MAPSTGGRQRHLAAPHAWKIFTHPKIQQNKKYQGKVRYDAYTLKTNMDTQNDGLAKVDSFKI